MQGKGTEFDWKFTGQISMFGLTVMLMLGILVYSCDEPRQQAPAKYRQGDVVWLKPDSTRAVISHVGVNEYVAEYYNNEHEPRSVLVPEFGIYSKIK